MAQHGWAAHCVLLLCGIPLGLTQAWNSHVTSSLGRLDGGNVPCFGQGPAATASFVDPSPGRCTAPSSSGSGSGRRIGPSCKLLGSPAELRLRPLQGQQGSPVNITIVTTSLGANEAEAFFFEPHLAGEIGLGDAARTGSGGSKALTMPVDCIVGPASPEAFASSTLASSQGAAGWLGGLLLHADNLTSHGGR